MPRMYAPQRYQKKSQLEHILLRPDSYIGSTEISAQQVWVMPEGELRMQQRVISFPPGLYKIVDEILVNAADVKARETEGAGAPRAKMTAIKVSVDQAQGYIRVWNDGEGKKNLFPCRALRVALRIIYMHAYIYIYIYIWVCTWVCIYVCMCVAIYACMYVRMRV